MNEKLTKKRPCAKECPLRIVMDRLGDKWSVLIISILWENETMRFNEIHNSIDGISLKVLTSCLRTLEADKFITRTVYAEVPPRVEYSLTEIGRDIVPYIQQLSEWAGKNLSNVKGKNE
jgi:DNA-binding HxlR family transcriptional regulator